ncbi:MAG: branched-chain amino acid ABC transporter permease, partial [Pygmaiobacter sp.]
MNLVNGFTGLFSLGQAGFMAIGAYTVGVLTIPVGQRSAVFYLEEMNPTLAKIELPFAAALLLGGVFAALVAFVIGYPVLRLKSDYLAIATLGFSEIIRAVIASPQFTPVTNGSYGLKKIPGFSSILIPALIATLCILCMALLIHSSYGRAFKAIREDEIAAEAMGINLFRHKQLSFVIGSFFTGIAGGMLAAYMTSVDSNTFKIALTYNILLIVVLGGMGSISGTIIASFLVTGGLEVLRFFDEPLTLFGVRIPIFRAGLRMVIFSLLLVAIVLFYQKGLMGNKELSWDFLAEKYKKLLLKIRHFFHKDQRKAGGEV